jgi:hypothetical protein
VLEPSPRTHCWRKAPSDPILDHAQHHLPMSRNSPAPASTNEA